MICDHIGCKIAPTRAPRVIVPSKTWMEPEHTAIKVMTTLHYCEQHRGDLTIGDLLRPSMRAAVEHHAKQARPVDFKPDFDAAFIEWLLMGTPEYRAWLKKLDLYKVVRDEAA